MMEPFVAVIETSALARFITGSPSAYATISALHILGIAMLVGAIIPVDRRLMGQGSEGIDGGLEMLSRLALVGFALAALAGILLASVRFRDYLADPAFRFKLGLLASAGLNAALLHIHRRGRRLYDLTNTARASGAAAVSICLWIAAIFAGRWIAFT